MSDTPKKFRLRESEALKFFKLLSAALEELAQETIRFVPENFPELQVSLDCVDNESVFAVDCLEKTTEDENNVYRLRRVWVSYVEETSEVMAVFQEWHHNTGGPQLLVDTLGDEEQQLADTRDMIATMKNFRPSANQARTCGWVSNPSISDHHVNYDELPKFTASDIYSFFTSGLVVDRLG